MSITKQQRRFGSVVGFAGVFLTNHSPIHAQDLPPSITPPVSVSDFAYPSQDLAKQAVFLIDDTRLGYMQGNTSNPVPQTVITKLLPLEAQPFYGESSFTEAVTKAIGKSDFEQYSGPVLTYSIGHPFPQPIPAGTKITKTGSHYDMVTGKALMNPGVDPFDNPPGSNFLPTVYTNMKDGYGEEMLNTLPSTQRIPYNLHPTPKVTKLPYAASPTDDLRHAIYLTILKLSQTPEAQEYAKQNPTSELANACRDARQVAAVEWRKIEEFIEKVVNVNLPKIPPSTKDGHNIDPLLMGEALKNVTIEEILDTAIDILEGNPLSNRAYSGFPVLHYTGPKKIKRLQKDSNGKWYVDINQIWYDQHVESDTALLNPTQPFQLYIPINP